MTDLEVRMTIKTLAARGVSNRAIARQLSLTEGAVRYHRRRMAEGATDGRAEQRRVAADYAEAIAVWMGAQGQGRAPGAHRARHRQPRCSALA